MSTTRRSTAGTTTASSSSLSEPPRRIKGCVGSRIRLILGKNGSQWLLILNEDDGNRQWQSYSWYGLPSGLADQLNNCRSRGLEIQAVDFGPSGAWFVKAISTSAMSSTSTIGSLRESTWWGNVSEECTSFLEEENQSHPSDLQVSFGSTLFDLETAVLFHEPNGYFPWRLPHDLLSHMEKANDEEHTINFVRLFHHNNYVISVQDQGLHWPTYLARGWGGSHRLYEELEKPEEENAVEVALAANNNDWVVIRPSTFVCSSQGGGSSGVNESLKQRLEIFYRDQTDRNRKRQEEILAHRNRVAQETAEREVAERAARQMAVREQAKRLQAKEAATANAARIVELESALEEHLVQEAKDLNSLEQAAQQVQELDGHIQQRRRSLQASMHKMSAEHQSRIADEMSKKGDKNENDAPGNNKQEKAECVICHMDPPTRAIIPCGHYCLCDECAKTLSLLDRPSSRLCPLCRGAVKDTLKIYDAFHA